MTGGSERLRITSDGKLGLNYNNPTTIIHALGNTTVGTSVTCRLQSDATANATASLELFARDVSNNNEICRIRAASGGTANVDLQFHTNDTERLRITSGGDVGIGDASPTKPLTVGTTTPVILLDDQSSRTLEIRGPSTTHSATVLTTSVHDLLLGTNNTERLRITSGGNISIGS